MVRNAFRSITRFLRLLRHKPPESPAMGEINAAAKRVQGAMHARAAGPGGFAGFGVGRAGRTMDRLAGQELADGHKKARRKTPPPQAR